MAQTAKKSAPKPKASGSKFKVPGSAKSKGSFGDFPIYDAGDYEVEFTSVTVTDDEERKQINIRYAMTIVDAPAQEDGSNPVGKNWSLFERIMTEDNPDYDPDKNYGVDRNKSACLAAGVEVDKNDNIDFALFTGKHAIVTITKRPGTDKNGKERFYNNITTWKPVE